ncbi:hypothetical protein BAE44_0017883, partial [Dichanthelium oligosanthes]
LQDLQLQRQHPRPVPCQVLRRRRISPRLAPWTGTRGFGALGLQRKRQLCGGGLVGYCITVGLVGPT